MKAIVMLLVLASVSFAQDNYRPHKQFVLVENEKGFGINIAGSGDDYGCLRARAMNINNFVFEVESSKWQRRANRNDSWADVPETIGENQVCGIGKPTRPGEYRWVAQIVEYRRQADGRLVGRRLNIASNNTLVVAGEDETAVEAVTWGLLKSRAKSGR